MNSIDWRNIRLVDPSALARFGSNASTPSGDTQLEFAVRDALAGLDERVARIVVGSAVDHRTFRALAASEGLSLVHTYRLYTQGMDALRAALANEPVVMARLDGVHPTSWDAAASRAAADIEGHELESQDTDELLEMLITVRDRMGELWVHRLGEYTTADTVELFLELGAIGLAGGSTPLPAIVTTVIGKQRDYGTGNIARYGLTGLAVRINDKVERLLNLLGSDREPSNESVADTWLDVVGYAIVGLLLARNHFFLPLADHPKVPSREAA